MWPHRMEKVKKKTQKQKGEKSTKNKKKPTTARKRRGRKATVTITTERKPTSKMSRKMPMRNGMRTEMELAFIAGYV